MNSIVGSIIRKFATLIFGLVAISVLVALCIGAIHDDIWLDSSILLTEMERIYDGYVPYHTIHINYPPLWFYLMAGLKWIFKVPYGCYDFYFAVNLLMQAISASAVYKISTRFCNSRLFCLFTSWLFLFLSMVNNSLNIYLDIPSVMFGLLGLMFTYSYLRKASFHFLWIGVIFSFSLLTKQFGLGFIALAVLIVAVDFDVSRKWQKVLFLLVGFAFVFLLAFLIFKRPFIDAVFLNGYSSHLEATIMDRVRNMSHMTRSFVRQVPLVLASLLLLPTIIGQNKWREAVVIACGVIGFSLQFLFNVQGCHYYLYMIPFAVLLLPLLSGLKLSGSEKLTVCVSCFFMIFVNISTIASITKVRIVSDFQKEQVESSMKISPLFMKGSKIWIADSGALPLYYLLNLNTPNMEKHGYCAGAFQISEKMATDQVYSADYVVCSKDYTSNDQKDIFFTPELRGFVESHESQEFEYLGKSYLLCNMHGLK